MRKKTPTTDGPPHSGEFDCWCTVCDDYRLKRLLPGSLVRPARLSAVSYAGHAWLVNEKVRWNYVWAHDTVGLYIGQVATDHQANYVKGALVLIPGLGLRLAWGYKLVTVK